MKPNEDKLRELILYIAERSEGDPSFGETKLNKILFYADFTAYARRRQAITGQPYARYPYGPVGSRVEPTLQALIRDGSLALARRDYHGCTQTRPMALREPDLSGFTGEEIAIVEDVLSELRGRGAREVSDLSHTFIGWRAAGEAEEIPYETVFLDDSPPTEDELRYAQQLVAPVP